MAVALYATRDLENGDEEAVLHLMRLSLGEGPTGGRDAGLWRWKHVENVFGPSYVKVACGPSSQMVGMRAFMQWGFDLGDRRIRAVRAVDTATHPDFRRMGIFSDLTSQVFDDVRSDGVDLIFNTPNQDVLPGYLKLGWTLVATVHPLIKVLNYPAFTLGMIRRRLGQRPTRRHPLSGFFRTQPMSVSDLLERGPDVDELIRLDSQSSSATRRFKSHRSGEYLRWRYANHPTISYGSVHVEEQGELKACAIFRTNTRFGLKEVVLCELFLAEQRSDLCRTLLRRLRSGLQADYLITYFSPGSFHRSMLERWGFRTVPREGMNFAVRPLSSDLTQNPLSQHSWDLTMGDLELF